MSNVTTYILTHRMEGPGVIGVLNSRIHAWRKSCGYESEHEFVDVPIGLFTEGPKRPEMDLCAFVTNYELELMNLIPGWIRTLPWNCPEEVVLTIYSNDQEPIIARAQ
jgi:hypothetical protein